jgi:hypothetical protein
MVVTLFLGFIAIAVAAVSWILVDDSKKRKAARRMRPRPTESGAQASRSTTTGGALPVGDGVSIMTRSNLEDEQAKPAGDSNLSRGAA